MKLTINSQLYTSLKYKPAHTLKMFYYDYNDSSNVSEMIKLPTDFIELDGKCLFLVLISFEVYANQGKQGKTEAFPSNRPNINEEGQIKHTFKYLDVTENKVYDAFSLIGNKDEIINYVNNIIMIDPLDIKTTDSNGRDVQLNYSDINFIFEAAFAYNFNRDNIYQVPTPIIEHFHKLSTVLSGNNTIETKNIVENFNLSTESYAGIFDKLHSNRDQIKNYKTLYPEVRCNYDQIKSKITEDYFDPKNVSDQNKITINNSTPSYYRFNSESNSDYDTSSYFKFDGTQDIPTYYFYTGYKWINMGENEPVRSDTDSSIGHIRIVNDNYYICDKNINYHKLDLESSDGLTFKNIGSGNKLPYSGYTVGSYFKLEPELYNYYQILTLYNLFIDTLDKSANINSNYLLLFNNK